MNEVFTRVINLIGQEKFAQINNKSVLVVGLGGVGGYALEGLVRSGIGRLIIADKDVVDITNLNRQIIATQQTVGKLKTEVFSERIHSINRDAEVIEISEFINENNLDKLFENKVDFVVDAIDTMTSKIILWKYCQQHNIPLIASLGMARRLDPTKLKITVLGKTENDPMAKALRSMARKQNMSLNIPVIFSTEKPLEDSLSLKTNLGSMMFVPATAGLMMAYYVINSLIDKENK